MFQMGFVYRLNFNVGPASPQDPEWGPSSSKMGTWNLCERRKENWIHKILEAERDDRYQDTSSSETYHFGFKEVLTVEFNF